MVSKIRSRAIKRRNNGIIPTWNKERHERCQISFSASSDEEKSVPIHHKSKKYDASCVGEDVEDSQSSHDVHSTNETDSDPPLTTDDDNTALNSTMDSEKTPLDINSPSPKLRKETSAYIAQLVSELERKPRKSAYFDEEAEEEGIDVPGDDHDEMTHEAGLTPNLLAEIQDLIDDDHHDKENWDASLHQSVFAKQLLEESLEESEMMAQMLEEKRETRLSHLALKRKYGKRIMSSSTNSHEANISPMAMLDSISKDHDIGLFSSSSP